MPNPAPVCSACMYAEKKQRPYLGPNVCTEYLWCHRRYLEVNPHGGCGVWCDEMMSSVKVKRRRSPDGAKMICIRIGKLNFSIWYLFDVEFWRSDSRQVDVSEMSGNGGRDVYHGDEEETE